MRLLKDIKRATGTSVKNCSLPACDSNLTHSSHLAMRINRKPFSWKKNPRLFGAQVIPKYTIFTVKHGGDVILLFSIWNWG